MLNTTLNYHPQQPGSLDYTISTVALPVHPDSMGISDLNHPDDPNSLWSTFTVCELVNHHL
jgi:hypothetical protein